MMPFWEDLRFYIRKSYSLKIIYIALQQYRYWTSQLSM